MINDIKLTDIPAKLLPVLNSIGKGKIWLNGNIVKEIWIYKETSYRVVTTRGEFRFSLDTDMVLTIT